MQLIDLFFSILYIVDCVWTWGPFSECSVTCGDGKITRDPIIIQPVEHGGEPCPPTETEPCNEGLCPGKTCTVSSSCNNGTKPQSMNYY